MIVVTHALEGETQALYEERLRFGKFLTAHITKYFNGEPIINVPITYYETRRGIGMKTTDAEALKTSLNFIGRADAIIYIRFPGDDLCDRVRNEKKAAHRLDIPFIELPFYRHRFEQQYKQDALLADQKRALNLLISTLQNT